MDAPANNSQSETKQSRKRANRYFIIFLLVLVAVLFLNTVKLFFVHIILASVFTVLFHPMYLWLKKYVRKRGIASILSCLLILLILLVPLSFVFNIIVRQTIDLAEDAGPKIREIYDRGEEGLLGKVYESRIGKRFKLRQFDWSATLEKNVNTLSNITIAIINQAYKSTFSFVTTVFITLFIMFYLFMDGDRILNSMKYIFPLDTPYENMFAERFTAIARSTVRGTFVIGCIQGTMGALTFLVFGVKAWMVWGIIMVILSLLPFVGSALIMIPAGVIKIIMGHAWQGIAIIAINVFIISVIDNVLRPRLVGHSAKMHDLLIFFSTIGGISVFGVAGFIVGPVIAALFLSILEIYSVEFKSHLDEPRDSNTG